MADDDISINLWDFL